MRTELGAAVVGDEVEALEGSRVGSSVSSGMVLQPL